MARRAPDAAAFYGANAARQYLNGTVAEAAAIAQAEIAAVAHAGFITGADGAEIRRRVRQTFRAYISRNAPVSTNPLLCSAGRAIDNDDPAALRSALANGADPNGMLLQNIASAVGVPHGRQHFPILFVAARRERLGLCQMLLEFGADPNLRGYHGMRALHSACWRGNCRIVQLLIKRGANINLANDTGTVPLFQALANGHRHLVLTMLRAGSRIQVRNRSDETKCNAALNEHLRRMRDSGGWEAHVARHRCACLGVIARCVGDNQMRARRLEALLAEQERLAPFRRDMPICWELLEKEIKASKKPPLPEDVMGAILSFWSPPGGR